MKVMCVNPKQWVLFGKYVDGPSFGDICTVTRVEKDEAGNVFYGLKEWDNDIADWDGSVFFVVEEDAKQEAKKYSG